MKEELVKIAADAAQAIPAGIKAGAPAAVVGGVFSGTDIGTICAVIGATCAVVSLLLNVYKTFRKRHED